MDNYTTSTPFLNRRKGRHMSEILVLKDIVKDYGKTRALDHVSINMQKGKIYGLVGENGAGKSTLAKIISGVGKSDSGEIYYKGVKYSYLTPPQARELEISIVHQSGNLAPNLSIVDNIFLGDELKSFGGVLKKKQMKEKAKEILEKFAVKIDPDTLVEKLSPAYQQIVAVAKALVSKSSLLIVDEGEASFDREELSELFAVLKRLKSDGVTIIYISHLLDNVIKLCDDIVVLQNGKLIDVVNSTNITVSNLAFLVVGREVKSDNRKQYSVNKEYNKVRIKVADLVCQNGDEGYSFEVREGEILGFTGPAGCGKTELLRTIFGLELPKSGSFYLDGRELKNNSPLKMIREGMAYFPEDRFNEGLVMLRSIEENINLPSLKNWFAFFINQKELDRRANKAADIARIKRASIEVPPTSLSGGNQQKTAIAKWLTQGYKYFLLNEPYKGIDIGAKDDIGKVLINLADSGCSLILASTEFADLIGLVDRLFVMVNHKIVAELKGEDINNKNIMEYYQAVFS